jgi:hypothetical protein
VYEEEKKKWRARKCQERNRRLKAVASSILSYKTNFPSSPPDSYTLTTGLKDAKFHSAHGLLGCHWPKTGGAIESEDEEEEKEDDWEWLEQQGARQLHNYWPSEAGERV